MALMTFSISFDNRKFFTSVQDLFSPMLYLYFLYANEHLCYYRDFTKDLPSRSAIQVAALPMVRRMLC